MKFELAAIKYARHALMIAALAAPLPLAAQRAPPGPAPDHRRLITDNLAKLFSADAKVQSVTVSELRQVASPTGLAWGTCVRIAGATNIAGGQVMPRVYVVTFSRGVIAERRAAAGQDCAGAKFERLG